MQKLSLLLLSTLFWHIQYSEFNDFQVNNYRFTTSKHFVHLMDQVAMCLLCAFGSYRHELEQIIDVLYGIYIVNEVPICDPDFPLINHFISHSQVA